MNQISDNNIKFSSEMLLKNKDFNKILIIFYFKNNFGNRGLITDKR